MSWVTPTRTTKLNLGAIRIMRITGANSTRTVSYSQKQLSIYPFAPSTNQGEKVEHIISLPMQDFFFYVYCTEDSTFRGSTLCRKLLSVLWTKALSPAISGLLKFSSRLVGVGQSPWEMPGVAHLVYRFEVSQRNTPAPHQLDHALGSSLIIFHEFQIYCGRKDLIEYLFYHITKKNRSNLVLYF